jgi:hypothetical protein
VNAHNYSPEISILALTADDYQALPGTEGNQTWTDIHGIYLAEVLYAAFVSTGTSLTVVVTCVEEVRNARRYCADEHVQTADLVYKLLSFIFLCF